MFLLWLIELIGTINFWTPIYRLGIPIWKMRVNIEILSFKNLTQSEYVFGRFGRYYILNDQELFFTENKLGIELLRINTPFKLRGVGKLTNQRELTIWIKAPVLTFTIIVILLILTGLGIMESLLFFQLMEIKWLVVMLSMTSLFLIGSILIEMSRIKRVITELRIILKKSSQHYI